MRVPILVSPDAGRGAATSAMGMVITSMEARGFEPDNITGTNTTESLAAAHTEVSSGSERLVVVGGDGLVNLGLQAVAGSSTILGVVPVGTGNDFVRGIDGFQTKIEASVEQALGNATNLDAIHTSHGWIASVATGGFSGDVNSRANNLRWPRGPRRYSVATMLELPRMQTRHLDLSIDGEVHKLKAALLAVGNTAWFGGGMEICPGADPSDGMLEVTVVEDVGRVEMLRFFSRVFKGTHLDHGKVSSFRGRKIGIDCPGLELWGDGELLGAAPVVLEARPGALRLAV